jgi:hypothetical protein
LLRCFLNVDPVQVKGIGVPILLYLLDLSWIFCEFNFDEYSINSAQNVNAVEIITLPLRASMVPS